jgi:hypothetical protein
VESGKAKVSKPMNPKAMSVQSVQSDGVASKKTG